MSAISVTRHHTLNHQHARAAAESLAKDLARRFDVRYDWEGDRLRFSRSGAKGELVVSSHTIEVNLTLGLLLRPLRSRIEEEIHNHLDHLINGQ